MNHRTAHALLILLTLALGDRALADDAEWGSLTGRFVLDGPVPAPKLAPAGGPGVGKVPAEDLVVNPQNRGVANIVVLLRVKKGVETPVHPDFDDSKFKETPITIREQGFRFVPHTVIVRVGQPIIIENADPVAHNPNIESVTGQNEALVQPLAAGAKAAYRLRAPENFPLRLRDNIHPWMQGNLYARDNPYGAVTDVDGKFTIKNLPVGELEFLVRHDSGYVAKATLGGEPVDWKKGVAKFEIKPGKNDLGEILVRYVDDSFR